MKIFIIGSDSFIARHFIQLYKQSYTFHSVARVVTGVEHEEVLPDFNSIPEAKFSGADVVYNCAAIVHQPKAPDKLYYKVNYDLAIKNAEKAKAQGVKLFVQMSTISVYGQAAEINQNTKENPLNAYGCSKAMADNQLLSMQDEHFKVLIIRPPMVYGFGNAPGNMMRLIKLADKGIPLPFKGISNHHDFINLKNLLWFIKTSIDNQLSGILLLSDGQAVSTFELLLIIEKYLGRKVKQLALPSFCVNLLKKLKPAVFEKLYGTSLVKSNFPIELTDGVQLSTVEDGIREMVEWYKINRN